MGQQLADAGWHQLVQYATDKAVRAGRRVVLVDPRYTSRDCSTPHCTYRKTDLTLANRTRQCPNCGVWHDRDINAARNSLHRVLAGKHKIFWLGRAFGERMEKGYGNDSLNVGPLSFGTVAWDLCNILGNLTAIQNA